MKETNRGSRSRRLALWVMLGAMLWATGCVGTGSRFPSDVQTSFAEESMQRMETERLAVYYPAPRQAEAARIASRLEGCLEVLEQATGRRDDWGLVPVYLPEVEFNNAYVSFGGGQEPHMVLPTSFTANIFGQFGFTPSPSAVGCHEMVHYVHMIQINGFYRGINRFFGPSINPQVGFDGWFFEGLATYYESQLVDDVGRLGSPIWEAYFAAGIADGELNSGQLSTFDRGVPYGGHYLVGSHFIGYLVEVYGEQKLWDLIARQGSSVIFPLAVGRRFRLVYGKTVAELFDDFSQAMIGRYPGRSRPEQQKSVGYLGRGAQLEVGPQDRRAIYSSGVDKIAQIEVVDAQGQRLVRRQLPDILPGRTAVGLRALTAMRFSEDGQILYFLLNHSGSASARTSLMALDIEANKLTMVRDDLEAVGGDLGPDDRHYYVAQARGQQVRLSRFELGSGNKPAQGASLNEVFTLPAGAYVADLRIDEAGQHVAMTLMENETWSVAILHLDDGEIIGRWTTDKPHHPVFDPQWIDEDSLVFAASDGERVQVMSGDLETGNVRQMGDVPYLAVNPRMDGQQRLWFLNRQDWGWSLDWLETAGRPTEAVRYEAPAVDDEPAGYGDGAPRPSVVVDDSPYSSLDGLFIPRLRVPLLSISSTGDALIDDIVLSLGMSGYDELGFHNWAVQGQYNFGDERLSGSVAYINAQLAPWYWSLEAADQQSSIAPVIDGDGGLLSAGQTQRDRYVSAQISRAFYGMPVYGEFQATEFRRENDDTGAVDQRRLVGPELGGEYRAARSTAYGGAQWLFGVSGLAAGYAESMGSDFTFAHLRSEIELGAPLPLNRRHRLRLGGRLRALPGVTDDESLIQIGGLSNYQPLVSTSASPGGSIAQELVPPAFIFQEPLRGYEDRGDIQGNQVGIVDLEYRLPLIVDWGRASVTQYLPAFFVHELGLEAFGTAATTFEGDLQAAAGASADLSMTFWTLPFSFRYQWAQRLVGDRQSVHTLGLGIGF